MILSIALYIVLIFILYIAYNNSSTNIEKSLIIMIGFIITIGQLTFVINITQ